MKSVVFIVCDRWESSGSYSTWQFSPEAVQKVESPVPHEDDVEGDFLVYHKVRVNPGDYCLYSLNQGTQLGGTTQRLIQIPDDEREYEEFACNAEIIAGIGLYQQLTEMKSGVRKSGCLYYDFSGLWIAFSATTVRKWSDEEDGKNVGPDTLKEAIRLATQF